MLGLRVPDATNAMEGEGSGQGGTEHMTRPDDYNSKNAVDDEKEMLKCTRQGCHLELHWSGN